MYSQAVRENLNHNSKLHQWDQRASVRKSPRRILSNSHAEEKAYFTLELAPICQHPIVAELGSAAIREILVQHLYSYLDFTTIVEQEAVNPVVAQIGRAAIGVDLPEPMLFDAHKIYCDEAYHALFSFDLQRQVERATAIAPNPINNVALLDRLEKIVLTVPAEFRVMARVFFVITYETMISSLLTWIPKDERVDEGVRQVVADHAADEGRHHVYFSKLLAIAWPQLTGIQKSVIGPLLPRFIIESLKPDYPAIHHMLANCDLDPVQIQLVIEETYPAWQVLENAGETARATLNLFERNQIMADPDIYKSFQACGLRWRQSDFFLF